MSEHTPGPWHLTRGHLGEYQIRDEAERIVAETQWAGCVTTSGNEEANARLIHAAPALLAACEALEVRLFREQGGQDDSPWETPLALLRKAIRKAKGD